MIINEQHYLARYLSAFSSKYSELNEYQLYAMHEKTPIIKNCAKLFLFQCQIPKKNTQKLRCTFAFTTFIIFRMCLWTQILMSHVLSPTVLFSGKGLLEATSHWIILKKMQVFYKMELVYIKESEVHGCSYPKSRRFLLNSHFCGSPAPMRYKVILSNRF